MKQKVRVYVLTYDCETKTYETEEYEYMSDRRLENSHFLLPSYEVVQMADFVFAIDNTGTKPTRGRLSFPVSSVPTGQNLLAGCWTVG